MNSRDQAHAEGRRALESMERRPWLVAALAVVAIIASTAAVFGVINKHNTDQLTTLTNQNRALTAQVQQAVAKAQVAADKAQHQAKAQCQIDKTIAEGPLMPNTSAFGLRIAAATRVAYSDASCDLGKLKPADPRVAALIRAGVH